MRLNRVLSTVVLMVSCGVGLAQTPVSGPPGEVGGWKTTTVASGIEYPWAMDWLPDGRALITSRAGSVYLLVEGQAKRVPVEGLPTPFVQGQGGLLDIALGRETREPVTVFMTLATGTEQRNRTILVRGTFQDGRIRGVTQIFRVVPDKSGTEHFGSRLVVLGDGTLLMSVGDGGNPPRRVGPMLAREQAQNKASHLGKILHLNGDGTPAAGNPFAQEGTARPEIWALGVRNAQGLAIDRGTGRVWASEHGPRGGDEINLIEGGVNYGWPLQSYGRDYRTGEPIGRTVVPGMADPLVVWVPSPAPSGLVYYTGSHFPEWRGSLLSGGLASKDIRRVALDETGKPTAEERLDIGTRVRDVRQGPDEHLYVLTDEPNGKVLRLIPK